MDNHKRIKNTPEKGKNNWNIFRNLCTDEISQNEKLSHNLVQKILYSRRLLIDHVESLEHCLPTRYRYQDSELFTFCNTALLASATIIQKVITPRSLKFTVIPLSIVTSGFCCLYLAKKFSEIRIKYIENDLDKLIDTIDKYGNCIKRNITYFNEILVIKATELIEPRHMERAWDCITSIKEVIDIVYEATRKLEDNYELPLKYRECYYPMEELRESDYFTRNITEYTYKNIKDFYNIFAYVQSQFLHRLAFTLLSDTSTDFLRQDVPEIELAVRQHIIEEEEYFHNLSIEIKRKQKIESAQFYKQISYPMKSGPLAVLRESSLNLCACIIGVAEECQRLDTVLQKINTNDTIYSGSLRPYGTDAQHLLEVANSMRGIEASLSICCEDFNRLMIVYNRFLGSKLKKTDTSKSDSHLSDSDNEDDTESDSIITNNQKGNDDVEPEKDDFYAYFCDEFSKANKSRSGIYSKQGSPPTDIELIDLDEKITKKKFKPVLQQLKITINPIREKMLEKERKVLQSKGIDVDQLLEYEERSLTNLKTKLKDDCSDNDDDQNSSPGGIDSELKIHKNDDKFVEMRKFLSEKQAMDIFGGSLPDKITLAEDILE